MDVTMNRILVRILRFSFVDRITAMTRLSLPFQLRAAYMNSQYVDLVTFLYQLSAHCCSHSATAFLTHGSDFRAILHQVVQFSLIGKLEKSNALREKG